MKCPAHRATPTPRVQTAQLCGETLRGCDPFEIDPLQGHILKDPFSSQVRCWYSPGSKRSQSKWMNRYSPGTFPSSGHISNKPVPPPPRVLLLPPLPSTELLGPRPGRSATLMRMLAARPSQLLTAHHLAPAQSSPPPCPRPSLLRPCGRVAPPPPRSAAPVRDSQSPAPSGIRMRG